jgi:predicted kinase
LVENFDLINFFLILSVGHILIGCPSSGKSSVAVEIANCDSNYRIVSTDKIREQLFGDETIQGDWQLIESEAFQQIQQHIEAGYPIIYDATNAKRSWRMALLQHLKQYQDIQWIGWHLQPPLDICKAWNKKRKRQVPEPVIERMYQFLKQFPPLAAEGFTAVYPVKYSQGKLDTKQVKDITAKLSRTIVNRHNRTHNKNLTLHSYSRLLDFDRLMHLISLLLHYPGVGNLQETNPELLKQILGEEVKFETSLEEICALLAKYADLIYADPKAIAVDLQWLEVNRIIGHSAIEAEIEVSSVEDEDLKTHRYSDIEPFQRLIKLIRFIVHHPFCWDRSQGSLQSLVNEMKAKGVFVDNYDDNIRKDIEEVLKPFQILPDFPMKRGYFAGTAILSQPDLIKVFRLLEAQAKSLEDPVALDVYETFRESMSRSQLASPEVYPVRAIYNRPLVDIDTVSETSLLRKVDEVEEAIESGKLLELNRIKGGGRFSLEPDDFFLAFPLQIVFHNIGWYLGFECKENNLFRFERLDRLFLGKPQQETRSRAAQEKSLKNLQTLYQCSGGIFLGNNPQEQSFYLSRGRKEKTKVEVTIELWFKDSTFRFITEGTKRFPIKQLKMSSPLKDNHSERKDTKLKARKPPFTLCQTKDDDFPNCFQVTLPRWSLEDIDLHRWILGFGGQVKVVQPPELVEIIKAKGEAIYQVYQSTV